MEKEGRWPHSLTFSTPSLNMQELEDNATDLSKGLVKASSAWQHCKENLASEVKALDKVSAGCICANATCCRTLSLAWSARD